MALAFTFLEISAQILLQALLSLNEIRSGTSSALDSQDRYPSGALTNGVSTEQLQTLVQTALKVCYAALISARKADRLL
jgi:hypothetical protein